MQARSSKFKRPLPALPPPHTQNSVPVDPTNPDAALVSVPDPTPRFVSAEKRPNRPWSHYHAQPVRCHINIFSRLHGCLCDSC